MDLLKIFEKQWKLIIGIVVGAIFIGGIYVTVKVQAEKKEKKAQESYFAVEKNLLDLKAKKNAQPAELDKKKTKQAPIVVDFAPVKTELEKIITDFPGSVAAQMAGIHLASLLSEEKNFDLALTLLKKVENNSKGLVNTLVQQQIGQLLADQNKCQDAIGVWQKIISRSEASFIHNDVKLQQALCFAKINDLKKAEEILTNLANQNLNSQTSDNSSVSKEAEKYLRLLQFKKATGT